MTPPGSRTAAVSRTTSWTSSCASSRGALLKPEEGGKQLPLGDGVDVNDKPFRDTFPYVALPDSGFDSKLKRVEPAHAPVPQPPA